MIVAFARLDVDSRRASGLRFLDLNATDLDLLVEIKPEGRVRVYLAPSLPKASVFTGRTRRYSWDL